MAKQSWTGWKVKLENKYVLLIQFVARASDERDVLAFQQNLANGLPLLRLDVHFLRVFENQVHVLIEANDVAFDAHCHIFGEPHLNASAVLQIAKDEVDGLDHHLLDLLRRSALVARHDCDGFSL